MKNAPLERPAKFGDESEARALVKNWLRSVQCKSQDTGFVVGTRKRLSDRDMIARSEKFAASLGGALILHEREKLGGASRLKKHRNRASIIMWHGKFFYLASERGRKKVFPVYAQMFYIDEGTVSPRETLCLLTEHSLARMLMKSRAQDIRQMNAVFRDYLPALYIRRDITQFQTDDFICLVADGFMVFAVTDTPQGRMAIAKTWVPRTHWNRHNEAKLKEAADFLRENSEGYMASVLEAKSVGVNILDEPIQLPGAGEASGAPGDHDA